MRLLRPNDLPELLEIGDVSYRVCLAKKLKNNDMGFCDDDMKLIVLSRNQELNELNATFWHEILHAIEFEFKLNLGHDKINKLEWAILQVMRQL